MDKTIPTESLASPLLNRTIEEGALSVTVACVSAVTGEEGGMNVTSKTTLADVMQAYWQQFPKEAAAYLSKIADDNAQLHAPSGMSQGGRMMHVTSIPEFVLWAMRAKEREYWDLKRTYSFIRAYPKFMVGDKQQKETSKGIIIK